MKLKDLWNFVLALLGFGGLTYLATSSWGVPQSGVYSQLMPADQWLYAGDTASCIWEIHPNTTKTINSVSYGVPGSWTACTQNTTDRLLWICSSVTVAEGNVTCPGIRVVQDEYPGTSETTDTENLTFKTASVKGSRFPGCTSADCTRITGGSVPSGTYIMRNLRIDSAITLTGNVNLTVAEDFIVGPSGSVSFGSSTSYTFNITTYRFNNSGAISGTGNAGSGATACPATALYACGGCNYPSTAGAPGGKLYVKSAYFYNGGSITLNGGVGGAGAACCEGNSPWYGTVCGASTGGDGGNLTLSPRTLANNSGSINLRGGTGGSASSACCGLYCSAAAANGGAGGILTVNSTNFSSVVAITTQGGDGGTASSCGTGSCCSGTCRSGPAGNGGTGGINNHDVSLNITITAAVASTGGSGGSGAGSCGAGSTGTTGTNNVIYCGNGSGMTWSNYNPTATNSTQPCVYPPSSTFVVPNSTSNITAYLQNISVNATRDDNITMLISLSKDNGTSWTWLSPDIYSLPYNSSNNNTPYLDTHRQGSDYLAYALMRVLVYNNSSLIFSDPSYMRFNLTDMGTTLVGTASPNGTISTNSILFTCNYSNSTGSMIEAATPYLYLDGSPYSMSFNSTSLLYYWNNNQTLLAGAHYWWCAMDKANYMANTSANTSFNISGFGIFLPTGYSTVKLACPFPTISGMTPAGQKAGIGIFRIQNYNSSATHNYSLFLNNTLPSGITVYARCDRFSPNLVNWTTLSTTTGYKGLLNIASTNSSAYCWLRMDCVGATPGTYTPIDYVFTEE